MKISSTLLKGVLIIEPSVYKDDRGYFLESFHDQRYAEEAGIQEYFVQDNHSRSERGVLRGLHLQHRNPQGKLVWVSHGNVFDVAADIDPKSSSFGQWFGIELSDTNHKQLWIPPGYAHGFVVLSEVADFHYKCTTHYARGDEIGVIWNDPTLSINWPTSKPKVSGKDSLLPTLTDLAATL